MSTFPGFADVTPFAREASAPGTTGGTSVSFRHVLGEGGELPFSSVAPSLAADSAGAALPEASNSAPDERVAAIERLLAGRPLATHAAAMLAASDHYGIDWRLLPVISILESQAGLYACGGNAWGFAKCQVRFATFEEGIPVVAATLSSYGRYDSATLMCIWVSGQGCDNLQAIEYTHRAASLYHQLGGRLALRAIPAEQSAEPVPPLPDSVDAAAPPAATATPDPAAPSPTPAPPTPTPSPPPPEPTPTATPPTESPSPEAEQDSEP